MKANRVLCFWLLCGLAAAAQAQGRKMQDQPDDGQWPMPAKNYASTRFSTLTDINTQTVRNLKLAWTFSTGLTRGHEAAPLVVNSLDQRLDAALVDPRFPSHDFVNGLG